MISASVGPLDFYHGSVAQYLLYFNSLVQVIQEAVPMVAHGSPDTSTIQNTTLE